MISREAYLLAVTVIKQYHSQVESDLKENKPLEKDIEWLLSGDLSELDISVRACNCLMAAKIHSIKELLTYSENDLYRFRNFGKRSMQELKNYLAKYNLKLKDE